MRKRRAFPNRRPARPESAGSLAGAPAVTYGGVEPTRRGVTTDPPRPPDHALSPIVCLAPRGPAVLQRQGKFLRFVRRRPLAARVTICVDPAPPRPYLRVTCRGRGSMGTARLQEVPADGYDDWKAGAIEGAVYALRRAGGLGCGLVISQIIGVAGDTTPAAVGAAAANAVWDALGYRPPADEARRLEDDALGGEMPA